MIELEEDLEDSEMKYTNGMQKYDKAATSADESDRMAKVLQNRYVDKQFLNLYNQVYIYLYHAN